MNAGITIFQSQTTAVLFELLVDDVVVVQTESRDSEESDPMTISWSGMIASDTEFKLRVKAPILVSGNDEEFTVGAPNFVRAQTGWVGYEQY